MKHFKILLPVFLLISGISFSNFNQEKEIDSTKKKEKKALLPLKVDRKFKLTTDEGTWISLDVSPDGKLYNANNLDQVYPKKEKAIFNWHQSKPENIPGLK